jgi:hypothetical protein
VQNGLPTWFLLGLCALLVEAKARVCKKPNAKVEGQ